MRIFLMILGILSGLLITAQMVFAQLILSDPGKIAWRTSHRHTGYLTFAVVLLYVVLSLIAIASSPRREQEKV